MRPLAILAALLLAVGGGCARNAAPKANLERPHFSLDSKFVPTWQNTTVKLVLPGTAGPPAVPSQTMEVPAKLMDNTRNPRNAVLLSLVPALVAIDDPRTHLISLVVGYGDFYLSGSDGITGFFAQSGTLDRYEPLFVRPDTVGGVEAVITQFQKDMPDPMLQPPQSYIVASLRAAVGPDFFGYGSQFGPAALKTVAVTDGVVRLDMVGFVPKRFVAGEVVKPSLPSPGVTVIGRPATVWVDLKNKTIIRAIDNGREMQPGRDYGTPKTSPASAPAPAGTAP